MKFKDKDGNVFEDIIDAVVYELCCKYRRRGCVYCPWHDRAIGQFKTCYAFARNHPAEAARLMGCEVVED